MLVLKVGTYLMVRRTTCVGGHPTDLINMADHQESKGQRRKNMSESLQTVSHNTIQRTFSISFVNLKK